MKEAGTARTVSQRVAMEVQSLRGTRRQVRGDVCDEFAFAKKGLSPSCKVVAAQSAGGLTCHVSWSKANGRPLIAETRNSQYMRTALVLLHEIECAKVRLELQGRGESQCKHNDDQHREEQHPVFSLPRSAAPAPMDDASDTSEGPQHGIAADHAQKRNGQVILSCRAL